MTPGANRHILSEFDAALNAFRDNAIMMASLTQRNLDHARQGLFELDEDHCNTAIADHEEIILLEHQMDGDGMNLLMRFQPVARDLRVVIATMKISANLERISNLAANIARRARKLTIPPAPDETRALEALFEQATRILDDAIAAFATGDLELARSLKLRDQDMVLKSHDLAEDITTRLAFAVDDGAARYLDLMIVIRHLEQIGNLCTSLAEDILLAYSNVLPRAADEV